MISFGLLFTYLMAYGGAVVALFSPLVGLYIYVCFAIIKPELMWYWAVPPGNYSRIIALCMLVGWALQGFGRWQLGRSRTIVLLLGAFVGWTFLGTLTCEDSGLAFPFLEELLKIFIPFLVGLTLVNTPARIRQLAWVIALSQGYVAYELNLSYLQGYNRLHDVGFANMDNNCVAIAMVTAIPIAFFLGLGTRRWWAKALAFGAAALMAHAVMFSFSRGGLLALVITGGVAFLLIPRRPVHYAVLFLAILLGLRMAGPEVRARFLTSFASAEQRDASAASRLELWDIATGFMKESPVFGIGANHWMRNLDRIGHAHVYAHSVWMQTGAELGIPGLLLLLGFYMITIRRTWPLTREKTPLPAPWLRDVARASVASLVGFLVAASFVSLVGLELPYYVVLLSACLLKLTSAPADALWGVGLPQGSFAS